MTGLLLLALLALTGCASRAAETPRPAGPLAVAESLYLDLRDVRDRIDVAAAAARNVASDGTPVSALAARHHELRRAVIERIAAVDSAQLSAEDRRAFGVMRRALARDLIAPVSTAAAAAVAERRAGLRLRSRSDPTLDPWAARTLFRYGLERPTREVVEEFLGGPVTPAALLKDMGRMKR